MGAARIISDPSIMMGKPVIGGTRITVELIPEKLAAGETADRTHIFLRMLSAPHWHLRPKR